MNYLYFIGGPWDQHKVAGFDSRTGDVYYVAMLEKLSPSAIRGDTAELRYKKHAYRIRRLSSDIWLAISEDIEG